MDAVKRAIEEVEGEVTIDYVEIRDVRTLEEVEIIEDRAIVALAAKVGKVRLIDNVILREG
jgi:pantoate--beta-alanine ligase